MEGYSATLATRTRQVRAANPAASWSGSGLEQFEQGHDGTPEQHGLRGPLTRPRSGLRHRPAAALQWRRSSQTSANQGRAGLAHVLRLADWQRAAELRT
jgi:hypothetical protein